ncbi:MAG TPA: ATP-binding protein [Thermoanaerobaculia bacterium]|nr:ATP-binding protein [Thermoanaerobaculia bacterium]
MVPVAQGSVIAPGAPPSPAEAPDYRAEISLDWLIRLRWGAVAGQAAVIAAAEAAFGGLPLGRLAWLVGLLGVSNVVLLATRRRAGSARVLCGATLTFDTLLLTALLYATGGAYNPFSVIYLVHITLAAVVLGSRWTWFLAALAVGCYGLLFFGHRSSETAHAMVGMRLHLEGMWVAFAVAAVLTAYFVVKLSAELGRRDSEVAEMRLSASRQQRLASVTTLAAGAAHELGTPLATIAVASTELERAIRALPGALGAPLLEDAELIRSEIERCRAILTRLASDAGQLPGEAPVLVRVEEFVGEIRRRLPAGRLQRLLVSGCEGGVSITAPRIALQQVAQNLLDNAFEAGDGEVSLSFERLGPMLRMAVRDRGRGMDPDELARAGEPFFSTKSPGAGLGLGLFIARTLAEQMGGRLQVESRPGAGTTVIVDVASAEPTGSGRLA